MTTQIKKNPSQISEGKDEVAKLSKPSTDPTVEVLYQKLGDEWYAFSVINNEVFFGKVSSDEGIESEKKSA